MDTGRKGHSDNNPSSTKRQIKIDFAPPFGGRQADNSALGDYNEGMANLLFVFTTPRRAILKEKEAGSEKRDYAMVKLYTDGSVVYRYFKKDDPHPEIQNRKANLTPEELSAFQALLKKNEAAIRAYALKKPVPEEAKKLQHTLLHVYGEILLIPDYIIDPKATIYIERYHYYPDPLTFPYYLAIRELTEALHEDLQKHGIHFVYDERPDYESGGSSLH
jgi:hypothetical protein